MQFIYDLIEELCLKNNMSITTLCKECKIPRSTMSDYKKGRIRSLSANTLCKIADYFSVSVDYLCGVEIKNPNEEALKRYLFGEDFEVTDEIWNDLLKYAEFLKMKKQG